jgi:hypothetical protein
MEQATQNPPAQAEKTETESKPLPATERDFHTRVSRASSPGFRVAVIIGIVVLLVVGFFVYRYVTSYEDTDDAQIDGHVNSISARITGHVTSLNVQDNQYVKAGTLLVEIDPSDYQVAYESAKADYENAQAAAVAAGVNVPSPRSIQTARCRPHKPMSIAPAPEFRPQGSNSTPPKPNSSRLKPTT